MGPKTILSVFDESSLCRVKLEEGSWVLMERLRLVRAFVVERKHFLVAGKKRCGGDGSSDDDIHCRKLCRVNGAFCVVLWRVGRWDEVGMEKVRCRVACEEGAHGPLLIHDCMSSRIL